MKLTGTLNKTTLLLALVAGYCDTTTFVAGDHIFSAHVTGNFITFAAQLMLGGASDAWVKLLTFPVFVAAVALGSRLGAKSHHYLRFLYVEAGLLLAAGAVAFWLPPNEADGVVMRYAIVMAAVLAMGLQNAFGKLFAKSTHGPTTVMTGNVTQGSLDLGTWLAGGLKAKEAKVSLRRQLVAISGFLLGCFAGAVAAHRMGLSALLPAGGVLLLYGLLLQNTDPQKSTETA